MQSAPPSRYVLFFVLAITGCIADLLTKHSIFAWLGMPGESSPAWVIPGYFGWETSLNEGALFGMGQGMVPVFAALSVLAFLGILYWLFFAGAAQDLLLTIALGCITAGIMGNLYDRLGVHHLVWSYHPDPAKIGQRVYAVRDWILIQLSDQWKWPNFNIADALLVCGAGLLIWHSLFAADGHPADDGRDEGAAGDQADRK